MLFQGSVEGSLPATNGCPDPPRMPPCIPCIPCGGACIPCSPHELHQRKKKRVRKDAPTPTCVRIMLCMRITK
jgi:hypothetical protein